MSHNEIKQRKTAKILIVALILAATFIVVGLVLTGCAVPSTATPDPAASAATTPQENAEPAVEEPAAPSNPIFGETITYEDGVSISTSAPAAYTPSEYSAGVVAGQSTVLFEFVITNNSSEAFDPATVFATAASGGVESSAVFDTENNVGFPPMTSVLPGATVKWNQAWSVADPSNITMEVTVGFLRDSVIFVSSK